VVELGSGVSTLVIAAALRSNGAGRLISIDADEGYAAQTVISCWRQDLGEWVELRFAALTEMKCEGMARPWYDTRVLADFSRGGPAAHRRTAHGPACRHPLSIAAVFLGPTGTGAIVLLDDAARPAERAMAPRGSASFPMRPTSICTSRRVRCESRVRVEAPMKRTWPIALALACCLNACTGLGLLALNTVSTFQNYSRQSNIAYGPARRIDSMSTCPPMARHRRWWSSFTAAAGNSGDRRTTDLWVRRWRPRESPR